MTTQDLLLKDETLKVPTELHYWPYCSQCRQPFNFHKDEPFAHCGCPGTSEWGDPRPAAWIPDPALQLIAKPDNFDHEGANKLLLEILRSSSDGVIQLTPNLKTRVAAFLAEPRAAATAFTPGTVYVMVDGRKGTYIRNHPEDGALHIFNEVERRDDNILVFFAVEEGEVRP